MTSTKTHRFILYSLGKWFEEANKGVGKPLQVTISKKLFIEVVLKAGLTTKQKRALYRNLETLEKQKLITYDYHELALTEKGIKLYELIKKDVEPYAYVQSTLENKSPISYSSKVQTIFIDN